MQRRERGGGGGSDFAGGELEDYKPTTFTAVKGLLQALMRKRFTGTRRVTNAVKWRSLGDEDWTAAVEEASATAVTVVTEARVAHSHVPGRHRIFPGLLSNQGLG